MTKGNEKKIKVMVISDDPRAPSGVGHQTKLFIEALLKTGEFEFVCLGGATEHQDYTPVQLKEGLKVVPVKGYGDAGVVRAVLKQEKPDVMWFMTDPRFYYWLWQIENEIRGRIPMVYYHVWDNYPVPEYNEVWYDSTDHIVCISKVTHDIVEKVAKKATHEYLPHAVDSEVFSSYREGERKKDLEEFQRDSLPATRGKFVVFWNNRNALRKQAGTLLHAFKDFADRVGRENVFLLMHTNPKDRNGPDLETIALTLGFDGQVLAFSTDKVNPSALAAMYNVADVTVNISDAEGFGLSVVESLSCETPVIVNMTGGMQEQVTDGDEWFGIGVEPAAKSVLGNQETPYIYEDHVSMQDVTDALVEMYGKTEEERRELGRKGRAHVMKNYSFERFNSRWCEIIKEIHEKHGSWETRTGYERYTLEEV